MREAGVSRTPAVRARGRVTAAWEAKACTARLWLWIAALVAAGILSLESHRILKLVLVLIVGIFVLVVHGIRAEAARRLGEVGEVRYVGCRESGAGRLGGLGQSQIVQGPQVNVVLARAVPREGRLGRGAGAIGPDASNAGQGRAPLAAARVPAAEYGGAEGRVGTDGGEGAPLRHGSGAEAGEQSRRVGRVVGRRLQAWGGRLEGALGRSRPRGLGGEAGHAEQAVADAAGGETGGDGAG